MSIREQRIDNNGIYILFTNGAEFSKSRQEIRALFQQQGTKLKTLKALRDELQVLVGDTLDVNQYTIDFRTSDGQPITIEWENS